FPTVADYRRNLAQTQCDVGKLLNELGRRSGPDGGEAHVRTALAIRQKLADDFPWVPMYRLELARTYLDLRVAASEAANLNGQGGGEEHYRKAAEIEQDLVNRLPEQREYRDALAMAHYNLGASMIENAARRIGPNSAEYHHREALAIRQKLADDFPAFPD